MTGNAWNDLIERLERAEARVAELESRVCRICDGHGMIGGPSPLVPDEGGEPCPECHAWILRKQAEAVEALADHQDEDCGYLECLRDPELTHYADSCVREMSTEDMRSYAQRLRQQADELDQ